MTKDISGTLLAGKKYTWLVTGAAGFIGSHLARTLQTFGQTVKAMDITLPSNQFESGIHFMQADIRNMAACREACRDVDFVLHHAAIASVPKSMEEPVFADSVNVGGFISVMQAAAEQRVKRFIYASSSAVYGDSQTAVNVEDQELYPMSPYAVGKYANELYAQSLGAHYKLDTVGFRYFNIYGAGQDPNGAYAAVIPKWICSLIDDRPIEIFGDGSNSRDFCHVSDIVQINILAALTQDEKALNTVYNVGSGKATTLNNLLKMLQDLTGLQGSVFYRSARAGDIKNSRAAIDKARALLGFDPQISLREGIGKTAASYQSVRM